MEDEPLKAKAKPRKSRRKCYDQTDDPSHVCSVNHVRVPAHCRLKRNRKKTEVRELGDSIRRSVPSVPSQNDRGAGAIAKKMQQDAVTQRIMHQL
jgi:hypothetical protein